MDTYICKISNIIRVGNELLKKDSFADDLLHSPETPALSYLRKIPI